MRNKSYKTDKHCLINTYKTRLKMQFLPLIHSCYCLWSIKVPRYPQTCSVSFMLSTINRPFPFYRYCLPHFCRSEISPAHPLFILHVAQLVSSKFSEPDIDLLFTFSSVFWKSMVVMFPGTHQSCSLRNQVSRLAKSPRNLLQNICIVKLQIFT